MSDENCSFLFGKIEMNPKCEILVHLSLSEGLIVC